MNENFALNNKYNLEKKLQDSKLGQTFLARSLNSGLCIIKTVQVNKSDSNQKISNIQNEAKVLANLNHKNIPQLIEVFTEENESKLNIYLVQKYIEGNNLQDLINKGQKFSEYEVIKIAIKVCEILEYIHSFSPPIIHQDIKPANIIISPDDQISLIDFGAVKQKILSENDGLSTIIGTQGYMSLEQFEGKANSSSDIYSLGLTILALLTSKPPLSLDKAGLNFTFKDVSISNDLKVILKKATEADWQKRYLDAKQFKAELEFFLSNDNKSVNVFNSTKSIHKLVKEQLSNDEKLKWFVKSKRSWEMTWEKGIIVFAKYGTFNMAFMIAFFFLYFIYSVDGDNLYPGLAIFLFLPLYITLIISFLKAINFFKSKTYVITDKRIMIIDSESNYKKVETFNNHDLKSAQVISKYNNNYGDILLTRSNEQTFIFKKISNIDIVLKILDEILQNNEKI